VFSKAENQVTIPLLDLKAQYRSIKPEIDAAVASVLENCAFILGPEVAAFEQEFAAYSGANFGVGVNSGTSALHIALLAAGIGPGDEVITTPFTFIASVASIGYTGARAVLTDIEPRFYNLDPAKIEAAITPRTKAILPVHLYGHPADMDPILEIARRHNLIVIEDAAQAHGAEYKGRRCGSMGDLACFSFYPGKNLGAYGEGGMVVTNNPEYAQTLRLLRDWGAAKKYEHSLRAYNYRMEGLQGAVLRVKLRHLEAWTEAKRKNAAALSKLLAAQGLTVPEERADCRHCYCVYTVRSPERDQLQATLQAAGVATGIHYPIPVHLQSGYADLGYKAGDFPVAEQAAKEVLALPIYPELEPAQIEYIAASCAPVVASART
jgi:dTDP-4-amino-4,6-dideoxygalactose transaminase